MKLKFHLATSWSKIPIANCFLNVTMAYSYHIGHSPELYNLCYNWLLEAIHHISPLSIKNTSKQIFICTFLMNYFLFTHKIEKVTFESQISTNTKCSIAWIKELFLLPNVDFYHIVREVLPSGGGKLEGEPNNNGRWSRRHSALQRTPQLRMQNIQFVWKWHACFKISQTFKCLDKQCPRWRTWTQTDNGLAKIAEDDSPRHRAEISPVKVKDIYPMNDKLPLAETCVRRLHICYIYNYTGPIGDSLSDLISRTRLTRRGTRNPVTYNMAFQSWWSGFHLRLDLWQKQKSIFGVLGMLTSTSNTH